MICRSTISRLLKDVKEIMKNPLTDNGIYYIHSEKNMMIGHALIVGPEDTVYFGGYFLFSFQFPDNYPFSPPIVTFLTNTGNIRFHPNLYQCGKVCLSILNTWYGEKWTSCQTISSVLLSLLTIFSNNPLTNEPFVSSKATWLIQRYNVIIEYATLKIAIIDIIEKKENVYIPEIFDMFYPIIKETYSKNYPKLLEKWNTNHKKYPIPIKIYFFIYTDKYYNNMNILIDYNIKLILI
jgi:ubiquitin-conjugating enzyme E2 Z